MKKLHTFVLLMLGSALLSATIDEVRVEQPITLTEGTYRGASALAITVVLGKATEVEVTISRAVAGRSELTTDGAFVGETLVVRTLPTQRLAAGSHTFTWDGLTADGKPVIVSAVAPSEVGKPAPPAALIEYPVDRFRITVKAGGEQQHRTFVRLGSGGYDPNRTVDTFCDAVWAPDGTLVVADRPSWRGRRYTPNWKLIGTQPHLSLGHESDPVECFGAQVDGQGNIYLLNNGSIYRYGPDGQPQEFASREAQITFPYPQPVANRLGLRLDLSRGVYQRSSGDGQLSMIDTKALQGKPGFVEGRFNSFAVGKDGTILLGTREPTTKLSVFAYDGSFVREITLPSPPSAATFGNGRFYIATDAGIITLDPKDLTPTTIVPGISARRIHIGRDGTLYVANGNPSDMVLRFTPDGQPKPFALPSSNPSEAHCLRLSPEFRKLPATVADGCTVIQAIVGGAAGDFWISASNHGDPGVNLKRLLHFAADGSYLPERSAMEVLERQPYHVFVGKTPAVIDLLLTDLTAADGELVATWTVTDFHGKEQKGTTTLASHANHRQVLPLALPATDMGHYRVAMSVARGTQVVFEHACAISRIPKPDLAVDPDSPFAICWSVEPGLAGIVGAKIERVGDTYWEKDRTNAGVAGINFARRTDPPDPRPQ